MNFMEAVKEMEKGKRVRRNQHKSTLPWRYDGRFYIEQDTDKSYSQFSLSHIQATDWEVVEEPKQTLYEKALTSVCFGDSVIVIDLDDVKQALKELRAWLDSEETDYEHDIRFKLKEIFGEEMLKYERVYYL
jgi:hypothetical protein